MTTKFLKEETIKELFRYLGSTYRGAWLNQFTEKNKLRIRAAWDEALAPFSHEDCLAAKDMIQSGLSNYNNFPPNTFQFIELCKMARNRRLDNIPKLEDKTEYSSQEFAEKHIKKIKEIINEARIKNGETN